jgi:Na+/phosphate symporter
MLPLATKFDNFLIKDKAERIRPQTMYILSEPLQKSTLKIRKSRSRTHLSLQKKSLYMDITRKKRKIHVYIINIFESGK